MLYIKHKDEGCGIICHKALPSRLSLGYNKTSNRSTQPARNILSTEQIYDQLRQFVFEPVVNQYETINKRNEQKVYEDLKAKTMVLLEKWGYSHIEASNICARAKEDTLKNPYNWSSSVTRMVNDHTPTKL